MRPFFYGLSGFSDVLPPPGPSRNVLVDTGIDPAEVDAVLIWHLHQDHIGGVFRCDGTPLFPNATFYAGEEEVAFGLDSDADARTAIETRTALWKRIIDEGWYIFAPHFPRPVVGTLADESGKVIFRYRDKSQAPNYICVVVL